MPFKSEQQRRWMYANKPALARKWSAKYHNDGGLIARSPSIEEIIDAAYFKNGGEARRIARHGRVDKASQAYQGGSKAITARDVLEFVPVIGDILAAEEVVNEIQKPNPNWYLVGILTAGTAIGVIPGIGDAAAAAIKKGGKALISGSKKAVDTLKQYEIVIDPNTLGSTLGNIKFRKKADLMREVPDIELPKADDVSKAVAKNQNLAQQFREADEIYEFSKTGVVPDYSGKIGKAGVKQKRSKTKKDSQGFDKIETETISDPGTTKPLYAKEIKTGIPEVDSIAPMIQKFAKQVPEQYREDAIQDGIAAAMEAAQSYRKGANVPFSTYAYSKVKFAVQNRTGITDPVKRAEAIKVDQTGLSKDKLIANQDGKTTTVEDILPDTKKSFYDQIPAEYRKLARLLNEQYDSRFGAGKLIREGDKVTRTKVIKDKEIAAELGISMEEFANQKAKLKVIMKDFLDSVDPEDLLYRKPGKAFNQGIGKGGPVRSIIKDGKISPNAKPDEIAAFNQAKESGQPVTFCRPIGKNKGGLIYYNNGSECFTVLPSGDVIMAKDWQEGLRKESSFFDAMDTVTGVPDAKIAELRERYQAGHFEEEEWGSILDKLDSDDPTFRQAVKENWMTPQERQFYDQLPEEVTVFRIQKEGEPIYSDGVAWTTSTNEEHLRELSTTVSQKFEEGDWEIFSIKVPKDDILAVLGSYEQNETVLNPKWLAKNGDKAKKVGTIKEGFRGNQVRLNPDAPKTYNKGGLIARL